MTKFVFFPQACLPGGLLSCRARRGLRALLGVGALAGMLAGAAVGAQAAPAEVPMAVVMNSGGASIDLLNMRTHAVIRQIPVLREPHHWALSPDHKTLFIGDSAGNQLLLMDPRTGQIRRRVPVADPYQLGFSPDGKYLVVNGLARNQVDIYDATSLHLVKRFPLSTMPSHLAFSPDSAHVYISLQGTNRLAALDLRTMQVQWDKPVGRTPAGVLWLNGHVLVADMGADDLAIVDPADGKVVRRVITGRGPHQLALAPGGKLLYVNNRVEGLTVALDPKTFAILHSYRVPGGPDCLDFAPDGKIWITERWAQRVAVLDPRTGVIQSIDVGRSPHGIFLTTDLR